MKTMKTTYKQLNEILGKKADLKVEFNNNNNKIKSLK